MKKFLLVVTILIALILIVVGCARTQTPTPSDLNEVVITLERTVCFGACPEYKLTIYGSGTVVYEGKRFVRIEGKRMIAISEEKVRQLLSEFKRIDYFSLNDSYEEFMATDTPSAFTSLTVDGKTKTVRHYHQLRDWLFHGTGVAFQITCIQRLGFIECGRGKPCRNGSIIGFCAK